MIENQFLTLSLKDRFYAGQDEIEGRLMDIIDTAIKQKLRGSRN